MILLRFWFPCEGAALVRRNGCGAWLLVGHEGPTTNSYLRPTVAPYVAEIEARSRDANRANCLRTAHGKPGGAISPLTGGRADAAHAGQNTATPASATS
jgi:hypothetical protein